MVMSVDPECSPELTAMLGSAIATCISDIPFDGPCATTQVGLIDGEFIINPTPAQKEVSDLAADSCFHKRESYHDRGRSKRSTGSIKMIEAIYKAHEVNQEIIAFIDKIVAECGKAEASLCKLCSSGRTVCRQSKRSFRPEEMEEAVFTDDKQTREENIREITDKTCRKHLQTMKSGLLFLERQYISTRRRLSVR